MTEITSEIGKTAAIIAQGLVDWYKSGGNPLVYFMAIIGAFCIISSTIRDSGKALGALFVFFIALPILTIEHLIKKRKNKKGAYTKL